MKRNHVTALLGILFLAACGASAREKALSTALTALNAARDGFFKWDETHKQRIAEEAPVGDARRLLQEYIEKREKVLLGFQIAYSTLAAAALDPGPTMLAEALTTVENVRKLFQEISGP